MTRTMKALAAAILAGALTACGGGGGSGGTNPNASTTSSTTTTTTTTTTPTAQSTVADFALFTDKTTISNTGSDTAKLTVVAVDANRNVVASTPVAVSTDSNSFFVPGSTQTDSTGTFTGTVQAGADKTDRDITVSVTVNNIVKRTTVRVSGSKLTLSTGSASVAPGASVVMKATLKDAAGNPIRGQSIKLGGTIAAATALPAVVTDSSGEATFAPFTAPGVGTYTISSTGGGTSAVDFSLTVFTAGTVPAAVIPVGATPSLSASPKELAVNAPGSTTNKSTLRFQALNVNTPIPNVRVQFVNLTTGSPAVNAKFSSLADATGADLTLSTMLYTDTSGTATIQYIPGQNSSATDGVRVRACYGAADLTAGDIANCKIGAATATVNFVDVLMTVAGQALSVSIGDDNKLGNGVGNVTYIKKFAVTVADSAGVAVSGARVGISVDLTHYGKGAYDSSYYDALGNPVFGVSVVPISTTAAYPSMATDPAVIVAPNPLAQRVWCPNEDVNRNGNVDPTTAFGGASENYNGSVDSSSQPTLEPRKSDLLISYVDPTVTTTSSSGVLLIQVEYAQRFATWLAYKIRVTADVAGSQGVAERTFVTDLADADKLNGAFHFPPYGIGPCTSAN